jgi:solute:Na+ symporter, SSS family
LAEPEDDEVLESFCRTVRLWGLCRPLYEKCRADDPSSAPNRDFERDAFKIADGLVWQTSLVTGPIYLVVQHGTELAISLAVCVVTSLILEFTWYDRLGPGEMDLTGPAKAPDQVPECGDR